MPRDRFAGRQKGSLDSATHHRTRTAEVHVEAFHEPDGLCGEHGTSVLPPGVRHKLDSHIVDTMSEE
ncbi:hypothetical protein BHE97_09440 [Aeromicrobium sp. PE09-221]|nr:hypothetical protein BHE97_09440 [Aeromicrobium sp. PE09-221]